MPTFGEELRKAREFKGMTLEDVSEITKINPNTLKAIEEQRLDILPEPYVRAFVKSYASALGMNITKVMNDYQTLVHRRRKEEEPSGEEAGEDYEEKKLFPGAGERIGEFFSNYGILIALIAVGIAVVVGLVLIFTGGEGDVTETGGEAAETTAAGVPVEGFNLSVSADTSIYMMVSIDSGDSLDYTLDGGSSRDFLAEEKIWMLISRAGRVSLKLNGVEQEIPSEDSRPVHFTVNQSGISNIEKYPALAQNL